jgi:DNA-directed RNA polymerase specialized sigma24 family protein
MGGESNIKNRDSDSQMLIGLAKKVVGSYVFRNVIPVREQDDVIMSLMEKFLNQRLGFDAAFEGKSKISTYYIAIMNRMCCEIIRSESKHWKMVVQSEMLIAESNHLTSMSESNRGLLFKMELSRLQDALCFLSDEEHKARLFIRYYFRFQISESDILLFAGNKTAAVSEILGKARPDSKAETFELLAKVTNLTEGKSVKGDAVRMWMNKQIDRIIEYLNFNDCSAHTRESLEILFEMEQIKHGDDLTNADILRLFFWTLILFQC